MCDPEKSGFFNAPGRTRTSDHRFRKPVLYPTELRALDEILAGLGGARHGVSVARLDLDLNVVAVDLNRVGCQILIRRRARDLAGSDVECRHMKRAHDLIARDLTFAQ